jgi:hypothetical protein
MSFIRSWRRWAVPMGQCIALHPFLTAWLQRRDDATQDVGT